MSYSNKEMSRRVARWPLFNTRTWCWACMLALFGPAVAVAEETLGPRTWWLPENVFPASEPADTLFYFILYLTGIICVAVFIVLGLFMVRYRHRPGRRSVFIHGNSKLEVIWTLIPTVILVLTAAFSHATWSNMKRTTMDGMEGDVIEVEVVGRQFQWFFHYPGADGKLGPRRLDLINRDGSEADELIGLDRDHADGRDDIVSPKMYVPVQTKVFVRLSSVDVIHSFFLPNFRVKQDAVPGLEGAVWLESTKTSAQAIGTDADGSPKPFDIVCAELCGQGHYKMRGQLFVVSRDEYDAFLAEEAEYLDLGGDDEDYY